MRSFALLGALAMACTRQSPQATPVTDAADRTFRARFTDIVAVDTTSREALLRLVPTSSERAGYVLVRVDDARELDRFDTATDAPLCKGGCAPELAPFRTTQTRSATWDTDGTYDTCFYAGSAKVHCFAAVVSTASECRGKMCIIHAKTNASPVTFAVVERASGAVRASGWVTSPAFVGMDVRGSRVALRFDSVHVVLDLDAKKVYERAATTPLAWMSDDTLLSCSTGADHDDARPCERLEVTRLGNAVVWHGAGELVHMK